MSSGGGDGAEGVPEIEEIDRVYPIRLTGPAGQDIETAHGGFEKQDGADVADAWKDGLYAAIRTLSRMPRKHALAAESDRFGKVEVRQLLYRRTPSSRAVYRVLFTIIQKGDDPPFVRVLHVRHAARRPLSQAAARRLLQDIREDVA